jgi:hypothetical protein
MKRLRRNSIGTGRRVVVITDKAKYDHARRHRSRSFIQDWVEKKIRRHMGRS